jgi:hypothetical protein
MLALIALFAASPLIAGMWFAAHRELSWEMAIGIGGTALVASVASYLHPIPAALVLPTLVIVPVAFSAFLFTMALNNFSRRLRRKGA